jgi:hypothetical protein
MAFYGYNRPGAKISEGVRESFWLQGMMCGFGTREARARKSTTTVSECGARCQFCPSRDYGFRAPAFGRPRNDGS